MAWNPDDACSSAIFIIHSKNGTRTSIVWIPGHAGIVGNEAANDGARIATRREQVDINIPAEFVIFGETNPSLSISINPSSGVFRISKRGQIFAGH